MHYIIRCRRGPDGKLVKDIVWRDRRNVQLHRHDIGSRETMETDIAASYEAVLGKSDKRRQKHRRLFTGVDLPRSEKPKSTSS